MSNAFVGVLLKLNPILPPKENPVAFIKPIWSNLCQYRWAAGIVAIPDSVVLGTGAPCGGEYSQSKCHSTFPVPVVDGLQWIWTSISLPTF